VGDKLPSFQFYPGDWRKSPDVQACSFAARGLWLELLCLMFESPRRGYLELNGNPVTAEQLARMVGGTSIEITPLLDELELAGVFSRDERGVIFSRRLDREQHIRNVRSEAGKMGASHGIKGGRPRKVSDDDSENPNNPPLTAKVDFAVSKTPGISSPENGKNGKPNGKITPSSSSSSSSDIAGCPAHTPPRERKPRARNPLFDAIASATGLDPATAGSHIGKTASALAAADPPYTPDDVAAFGRRFLELCPYARGERDRPLVGELQKYIGLLRAGKPRDCPAATRLPSVAEIMAAEASESICPLPPSR